MRILLAGVPIVAAMLSQLLVTTTSHALSFQPYQNYSSGAAPLRIISADFHGGLDDVAVINENGSDLLFYLNNGDGTFQAPSSHPSGSGTRDLAWGRFTPSTRADVAVAGYDAKTIAIFRGYSSGTLAAKPSLSTPEGPLVVLAAKMWNAVTDILAVDAHFGLGVYNIRMFQGNNDGTFSFRLAEQTTDFLPSAGGAVYFTSGNARQGFVLVDSGGNRVKAWVPAPSDQFASRPESFSTGVNPVAVATGHFNNDQYIDLAVANQGGDSLSVLLGNGDGTFQVKVDYASGASPRAVAVGDFNGDGKADLMSANSGGDSISYLKGNGDGTFQTKVDFSAAAGSAPRSLTAADFNGDDRLDVAVVNGGGTGFSVFLNSSVPVVTLSPSPCDIGEMTTDGPSATRTVTISNSGDALLGLTAADITGADASQFAIESGGTCSFPTTMVSGASCTVILSFTPTAAGLKTATLNVYSDAPGSPATATVTGTGVTPTTVNITFTIGGSGAGSVQARGLWDSDWTTCSTGCSLPFSTNSTVKFRAVPDQHSLYSFTGCTPENSCTDHVDEKWIVMNIAKSIDATFTHVEPVRVAGAVPGTHETLQGAYAAATDGDVLLIRAVVLAENLLFDSPVAVTLDGGYGGNVTGYDTVSGVTTVAGSISITDGTITPYRLVLIP